jgi:hypothetical protein
MSVTAGTSLNVVKLNICRTHSSNASKSARQLFSADFQRKHETERWGNFRQTKSVLLEPAKLQTKQNHREVDDLVDLTEKRNITSTEAYKTPPTTRSAIMVD